jgi:3-oxoacyl-[acyl-carrier-protein] synthase II
MNKSRARVAVTGLGAVTALGQDIAETFSNLTSGARAFSEISEFDASVCLIRSAAEIKNFRVSDVAPAGRVALYSRADALAVAAARAAVRQAGVENQEMYLAVGGTGGGMREAEPALMADASRGMDAGLAQKLSSYPIFSSAKRIAEVIDGVRHSATFCSACSSSATAIAQAATWVATGRCNCALAGGTDALSLLTLTGFAALGAMSKGPCRPFDQSRSGMSLGEGAAFIVLEDEEEALKRGAPILAWLDGWSLGAEAHHITHPEPSGARAAQLIVSAVRHAGLKLDDIGYFNAHGTGTLPNDTMEASAVRSAFANHSERVAVSTAKGQLGHTLGASGAIEAAITILALGTGRLPPTMGLTTPAEDTQLDHIISESRTSNCRHALSSSFGFGGLGAVLAFSHVDTTNRIPSSLEDKLVISAMSELPVSDDSDRTPSVDPIAELDPERSRRFDRVTALTCNGGKLALHSGGLEVSDVGMIVGNALGNVERLRAYLRRLSTKGLRGIAPAEFPHLIPSSIAGNSSIYLGLKGPITTVTDDVLCNEAALDFACGCLQLGLAQAMLAGVVESPDTGIEYILDPLQVFAEYSPLPSQVSNWFLLEPQRLADAGGRTPLARILDTWVGGGLWYQYFIDHEAPLDVSRLAILCSGVSSRAFERLPELGRWRDATRQNFENPDPVPREKSGAALAAALAIVRNGAADEVILVARAHSHCSVIRLGKAD